MSYRTKKAIEEIARDISRNTNSVSEDLGWLPYFSTLPATFTDSGDTVTVNNHGLYFGAKVVFSQIVTTTGISVNTVYYAGNVTANTFRLFSTYAAAFNNTPVINLTNNGTGLMRSYQPVLPLNDAYSPGWSYESVAPLRGRQSYLLNKTVSGGSGLGGSTSGIGLGTGAYIPFTVERADFGRRMMVSFDYEVTASTAIPLTDVTNNYKNELTAYIAKTVGSTTTLTQITSNDLITSTAVGKTYTTSFTADVSPASYKLVFHSAAATPTAAYSVKIDNISIKSADGVQLNNPILGGSDGKFDGLSGNYLTVNSNYGTGGALRFNDINADGQMSIIYDGLDGGSSLTISGDSAVYFAVPTYFGSGITASSSSYVNVNSTIPALTITQTGTGAALRVEDSANPDATPFIVDTNGNVGIGTATPAQKLSVTGVIESTTGGIKFPDGTVQTTASSGSGGSGSSLASTSTFSANGTIASTVDVAFASPVSADISLTLPAVQAGRQIKIKRTDATVFLVTILPAQVGTLIDGEASFTLAGKFDSISLISNGTNWFIV